MACPQSGRCSTSHRRRPGRRQAQGNVQRRGTPGGREPAGPARSAARQRLFGAIVGEMTRTIFVFDREGWLDVCDEDVATDYFEYIDVDDGEFCAFDID